MSDINIKRFTVPITTGTPNLQQSQTAEKANVPKGTQTSFQQILQNQIAMNSDLAFSKHAVMRAAERNVSLSESNMARLNEGARLAEEKGLKNPLILVDKTAFIVNVKNNTVITTVSGNDLKGNVFTNIDGTVIV